MPENYDEQRLCDMAAWERRMDGTASHLLDAIKRGDEEAERVVKESLKILMRSKLV